MTLDLEKVRTFVLDTVAEAGVSLNEDGLERIDRKLDRIRATLDGTNLEGAELEEEVLCLLAESWG